MKFGLGQFTLQIPPWDARDHAELYADTLDLAALADASGFDYLWLAEHHGAEDGYIPSLLPFLAAVATRTVHIELGTAVLLAPFHDPFRVAEDAAVVDNISRGRLNLGIGLGWAPHEYRMFNAPTKGRGRLLEEFVAVLDAAWTAERFSTEGSFFAREDVMVRPKPVRKIPIWIGGNAEGALARAARIADGHFPPSTIGVDGLVARGEQVLALRQELGLEGPYRYGGFITVGLGSDADDGWAKVRDGLLHLRGSYMTWGQGRTDLAGAREAAAPFEDAVRDGVVCGTPPQIVERLKPVVEGLRALDADTFLSVVLAPPGTPVTLAREQIDRFASEVIPALR